MCWMLEHLTRSVPARSPASLPAARSRTLRKLHRRHGQPRRHHQGRQWPGATYPGRSRLELSASSTGEPREADKGGGRTEGGARDCLESANEVMRALSVAHPEGQAANRRRHGDRPRAVGLYLGDQSRGHGQVDRRNVIQGCGVLDKSYRAHPAYSPCVTTHEKRIASKTSIVQQRGRDHGKGKLPSLLRGRSVPAVLDRGHQSKPLLDHLVGEGEQRRRVRFSHANSISSEFVKLNSPSGRCARRRQVRR